MLTLYYSPGACSLASHIALINSKLKYNLKKVDLKTHTTEDGKDFYALTKGKGYVPVLQFANGDILTEGTAILFYLAEHTPNANLATTEELNRYRLQEALTFVSSELHKTLGAYFNPQLPEDYKPQIRNRLSKTFGVLENQLSTQEYLVSNTFSPADAYCYTVLRWLSFLNTGLSLNDWPNLNAYYERIGKLPEVVQALQAEGLKN